MRENAMSGSLFNLMAMIFIMMLAGFILQKARIITKENKGVLSGLIINLILPCNIIKAFCIEISMDEIISMSMVLIISILIQVFCLVLTKFLYNRFRDGEKQVYQYATVCSNSGFMGNPMAQGVFGDMGLLYAAVFVIPQRIVMWTAGVTYFAASSGKKTMIRKVLLHPCIIAVIIGLILMITQFKLPGFLDDTLSGLSQCCTGLTMIYIGSVLAEVNFKTIVSLRQIYFALIRLVIIPLIVLACCLLFRTDSLVTGVCVLLTAMPAGSTTAILAAQYHADEESAVKCVVFTTALSVITIPVWSVILTGML